MDSAIFKSKFQIWCKWAAEPPVVEAEMEMKGSFEKEAR